MARSAKSESLLPLREKVACEAGRMRGRAGVQPRWRVSREGNDPRMNTNTHEQRGAIRVHSCAFVDCSTGDCGALWLREPSAPLIRHASRDTFSRKGEK